MLYILCINIRYYKINSYDRQHLIHKYFCNNSQCIDSKIWSF